MRSVTSGDFAHPDLRGKQGSMTLTNVAPDRPHIRAISTVSWPVPAPNSTTTDPPSDLGDRAEQPRWPRSRLLDVIPDNVIASRFSRPAQLSSSISQLGMRHSTLRTARIIHTPARALGSGIAENSHRPATEAVRRRSHRRLSHRSVGGAAISDALDVGRQLAERHRVRVSAHPGDAHALVGALANSLSRHDVELPL
jgi:hypothetical protein